MKDLIKNPPKGYKAQVLVREYSCLCGEKNGREFNIIDQHPDRVFIDVETWQPSCRHWDKPAKVRDSWFLVPE